MGLETAWDFVVATIAFGVVVMTSLPPESTDFFVGWGFNVDVMEFERVVVGVLAKDFLVAGADDVVVAGVIDNLVVFDVGDGVTEAL